jgi:hypothetical protein
MVRSLLFYYFELHVCTVHLRLFLPLLQLSFHLVAEQILRVGVSASQRRSVSASQRLSVSASQRLGMVLYQRRCEVRYE